MVPHLLLVALTASSGAQDAPPDAAALLDRAQEAWGPAAARQRGTCVLRGTTRFEGLPGEGTFTETLSADGRVRFVTEMSGYGTFEQGSNGDVVWETHPASGAMLKKGPQAAAAVRRYALRRHADWRTLYTAAERIGRVELDGRPHWHLRLVPEVGDPDEWWIDAETLLPSRILLHMNPQGTMDWRIHLSDWRRVEGVPYPHVRRIEAGPVTVIQTYTSVELDAEVPDEHFDVPQVVADRLESEEIAMSADDEIRVKDVPLQHVATIQVTCQRQEIGPRLAVMLPEVMVYLNSIGARTLGPPFSRYHGFGTETIDLEAGIPVSEPVQGRGRVQASTLPQGKAAVAWHVGPYDKLGEVYTRLEAWLEENEWEAAAAPWEVYWTDPGFEPDPARWRTQVLWPVRKRQ